MSSSASISSWTLQTLSLSVSIQSVRSTNRPHTHLLCEWESAVSGSHSGIYGIACPLFCQQQPQPDVFSFPFVLVQIYLYHKLTMKHQLYAVSQDVKMWICHLAAQPGGLVPVGRRHCLTCLSVSACIYFCLCLFTSPLCQPVCLSQIFLLFM